MQNSLGPIEAVRSANRFLQRRYPMSCHRLEELYPDGPHWIVRFSHEGDKRDMRTITIAAQSGIRQLG